MPAERSGEPRSRTGGWVRGWSLHCLGFSPTLQDADGLVDFRDVALALAALSGGRSLEELTRLAFEVSGRCGGQPRSAYAHPTHGELFPGASG